MRFTDAHWERAGTGKRVCELTFEKGDTIESYPAEMIASGYDYSVARVPAGSTRLIHSLEAAGFRYLENQLQLTFDIAENVALGERWRSRLTGYSFRLAESRHDIEAVAAEVGRNIFISDRVSTDPFWGRGLAARRYVNWLLQLADDTSSRIYIMVSPSGLSKGFFVISERTPLQCSCPLAGIYQHSAGKGYFLPLLFGFFDIALSGSFRKMTTAVSSNNIAIQRYFSRLLHYSVDKVWVVLRKVEEGGL